MARRAGGREPESGVSGGRTLRRRVNLDEQEDFGPSINPGGDEDVTPVRRGRGRPSNAERERRQMGHGEPNH